MGWDIVPELESGAGTRGYATAGYPVRVFRCPGWAWCEQDPSHVCKYWLVAIRHGSKSCISFVK